MGFWLANILRNILIDEFVKILRSLRLYPQSTNPCWGEKTSISFDETSISQFELIEPKPQMYLLS